MDGWALRDDTCLGCVALDTARSCAVCQHGHLHSSAFFAMHGRPKKSVSRIVALRHAEKTRSGSSMQFGSTNGCFDPTTGHITDLHSVAARLVMCRPCGQYGLRHTPSRRSVVTCDKLGQTVSDQMVRFVCTHDSRGPGQWHAGAHLAGRARSDESTVCAGSWWRLRWYHRDVVLHRPGKVLTRWV